MITVYDEDPKFEEKARQPEGYIASYKGYKTYVHWSEEKGEYYGIIEGTKKPTRFAKTPNGLKGEMLMFSVLNEFTRIVDKIEIDKEIKE